MAIDHGWAAELGKVGDPDDVSGEWISRGTLFTPLLAPLLAQAALTALALVRRRVWQIVAGAGLAIRLTGLAGALALVVAGVAIILEARRRA